MAIEKDKDLQNIHISKDRVTRTQLKTGDELRCSGKVGSSCSTCGARHVTRILKCGKNITAIYTTIIQKISIGKFTYILKKWSFHQSICDINI